jgi:hypothetical protein
MPVTNNPEGEPPTFSFSVDGTHEGWQLAQLRPAGVHVVRNLDAEESARLNRAVYTVRDHIKARPTRLLAGAAAALTHAIDTLPAPVMRQQVAPT